MGAAFLRSSFLYGKEYDFTAKSLRDSLVIDQQMQTLHDVCDTLEQFRNEANRPIDIYAEYRNRDQLKSREELAQITRYAEELYLKYILTPPREGAKFRRILTTKQIVFDKEAYLATMLRRIVDRDMEALENEKEHFIAGFLKGSGQLADMYISNPAVDKLIRKYGYKGRINTLEQFEKAENQDLRDNMGAAAHLIHGSSDGRFTITYAVKNISKEEIESVGFQAADYEEMARRYDPEKLTYGYNTLPDGEEIYFIPNPALGLWINKEKF